MCKSGGGGGGGGGDGSDDDDDDDDDDCDDNDDDDDDGDGSSALEADARSSRDLVLSVEDEYLLVMMKLRLGLTNLGSITLLPGIAPR